MNLADIIRPPAWHRDALCIEYPDVTWFPAHGVTGDEAKEICLRCLVRSECLAWAIENKVEYGIWGGLGYRKRLEVAQAMEAAA